VIDYVFEQTGDQPWLVNALGYEVCFRAKENRDRAQPISLMIMSGAREKLIERGIPTSTNWPTSCGSHGYTRSSVSS